MKRIACLCVLSLLAACASPVVSRMSTDTVGRALPEAAGGGTIRMVLRAPIRYPEAAYVNRVRATLMVDIAVDAEGHPVSAKIFSREVEPSTVLDRDGTPRDVTTLFDEAILDAVMKSAWVFENHVPQPKPIYFRLPVSFTPG